MTPVNKLNRKDLFVKGLDIIRLFAGCLAVFALVYVQNLQAEEPQSLHAKKSQEDQVVERQDAQVMELQNIQDKEVQDLQALQATESSNLQVDEAQPAERVIMNTPDPTPVLGGPGGSGCCLDDWQGGGVCPPGKRLFAADCSCNGVFTCVDEGTICFQ